MRVKTITVDGSTVGFLEFGTKQKPPMVLIHGFHGTAQSCATVSEFLSETFHVVSPDLPGFGASDRRKVEFNISKTGQFVTAFLRTLRLDHVYLCGISLGGTIAVETASILKEHVSGLLLLNPLLSKSQVKLSWKQAILRELVLWMKFPMLFHAITGRIMANDRLMKYLITFFSTSRKVSHDELTHRLNNVRVCDTLTYLEGLDVILRYEWKRWETPSPVPMVVVINPSDELLDSKRVYTSYWQTFPNITMIHAAIDNHNAAVKPTAVAIKQQYPQLMEKIMAAFFPQKPHSS